MDDVLVITIIAWMFAVVVGGIWGGHFMSQRDRDRQYRRTYIVTFPNDGVPEKQLNAWLRAMHGLLVAPGQFRGLPTLTCELWGTKDRITPRLKVPPSLDKMVRSHLTELLPGVQLELEKKPPRRVWTSLHEIRMSNRNRRLAEEPAAAAAGRIKASFRELEDGDTLLLQWVWTAAGRRELPVYKEDRTDKYTPLLALHSPKAGKDEIVERRKKLDEPGVKCVLRVAADADTEQGARDLTKRVRDALAPSGTGYTHFRKRDWMGLLPDKTRQERVTKAAGSTSWPIWLGVSEFTRVMGWPVDAAPGMGFAPGRSADLPPNMDTPTEGIVLGHSTYGSSERPVAIPYEVADLHIQITGKAGYGKTEEMATIARQVMEAGHGLILLEKAGDLFQKVLDYVPQSRFEDVIVFDMADYDHPIGFNPLDQFAGMSRTAAVDSLVRLLQYKIGGERNMGVWAQEVLHHGLMTIAETPGLAFIDVLALLNPRTAEEVAWSDYVTRQLKDPELLRWWQGHDMKNKTERMKKVEPVESRMWQFTARRELRNIIGQSESAFTWQEVLRDNKILLMSFKGVPEDSVELLCAMAMSSLWSSIKATPKDRLSFLMLDESREFVSIPIDLEMMLLQARKHKVSVVLANQDLGQLKPMDLQDAAMNNMANKIVFGTYEKDAATWRRNLRVDEQIFMDLPKKEAVARVLTEDGRKSTVTIKTLKPVKPTGLAGALIEQSRKLHAKEAEKVQLQIENRRRPPQQQNRPPRPPVEGWGV